MGQRSQIYIRIHNSETEPPIFIARYHQWHYGIGMVSTATRLMEYLNDKLQYLDWIFNENGRYQEILKYCDVVWYTSHVTAGHNILSHVREYGEDAGDIFAQDNNDGACFIDVRRDGIKYAFTDYNFVKSMGVKSYLKFDEDVDISQPIPQDDSEYFDEEDRRYALQCASRIGKVAKRMTNKELAEFINYDYSYALNAPYADIDV